MRWWLPLWVLTSGVLALFAAGVEYGLVVVGVYIGANALAMTMAWFRRPPVLPPVLRGLCWAAALQLPIVLFTVLDRDGRFAAAAPSAADGSPSPSSAMDLPPPAPGDLHGRMGRGTRGHGLDGRDH